MKDIDIKLVNELFTYNPETGEFRNKVTRGRAREGELAGSVSNRGYLKLQVAYNQVFAAHRVAWAIYYNEQPPKEIDHKNRNKTDNSISNLIASDRVQNNANKNCKGYTIDPYGRYRVRVTVGGKRISVGIYDTPEEAQAVFKAKKAELLSNAS